MVALGIILIVAGALVLALGRFAHAHTVGLVVFVLGALLILLGVLDVGDGSDAAVLGLPFGRLRALVGRLGGQGQPVSPATLTIHKGSGVGSSTTVRRTIRKGR